MPRVLITWDRPFHLSEQQATDWTLAEVHRLARLPGVESVALTRVTRPAPHPGSWDWVCELHLPAGADGAACVEHPACADWLRDLHMLGMRPAVAILDGTEVVR